MSVLRASLILPFLGCLAFPGEPRTEFRLEQQDGVPRVQIRAAGEVIAESPREGLWSIACDWRESWPAEWRHGNPTSVEPVGEWTVLRGELQACGGVWSLEDAYRAEGRVVRGVRRFTWKGAAPAPRVTLSVRFQTRAEKASALLPGILYYGNPSGARSGRVPVWTGKPGEEAIFEEHRYPMPFAYLELQDGAKIRGVALHSLPSPAPYGNLRDQWWSLGVTSQEGSREIVLLSGPCAANGKRSSIKAYQRQFAPYDNAYLNVPPGAVIEKTFFLEAFPVDREGAGFQRPVRTSLELFSPYDTGGLPEFAEIIRAKYRYANSRWYEKGDIAGFRKYQDRNQFVMGWTGQAEALGYALPALADGLGDPGALKKAQLSLDFLSTAEFYDGGFHNWYDIDTGRWSGEELLNQGQAMLSIARAIQVGRRKGLNTARWEGFLRKAADLHSARILAPGWRPVSTNEGAFIAPLVMAFELFQAESYRAAALKAGEHYASRHLSMREPYWGGTLDARCEDKEGAAAAFQGFLALYEMTHRPEHLEWARHACDVALTYVVVWDIDLPAGRLRDHMFRTRGWTAVSSQNQHLDVWGTILAPDIYRLGQIDQRQDLQRLAIVMYRTCGQLIDAYGSQGEQMEHTNYLQRSRPAGVEALRGGYNEAWTVFWITAHFLTGAARFQELGVPIWRQPQ